ncbi:MAG: methyltransferase domain-containing protein [Actinobacteria bacterium]|nr:methyltransferase domain-containing protein [Actinomycetota bacterium]
MDEKLYELPFDQFQRYKVTEEIVNLARNKDKMKILDVGGYPGLISDFLPDDETYILDIIPSDKSNYILGDGTSLSFEDKSFDIVTSLDVYEHISPEKRDIFIKELCRVTNNLVILSAPFNEREVKLSEQLLYEYVLRVFGEFPTLKQHIDYGLPDINCLMETFVENNFLPVEFPSGNLYNWLIMMLVKHYIMAVLNSEKIQAELDRIYNINFSYRDYGSPSYRHVVVASRKKNLDFLNSIKNNFTLDSKMNPDEASYKLQLFQMLIDLFNLQVNQQLQAQAVYINTLEQTIRNLERKTKANERNVRQLKKEIENKNIAFDELQLNLSLKETHLSEIENSLAKIKKTIIYKLYRVFNDDV